MTTAETYPIQSDAETFRDPVIIQYNDGACALKFQIPGDCLELGYDSPLEWAQGFWDESPNMVLFTTEEGNLFGLAKGIIFNFASLTGYAMPEELPPIVIGEPWVFNTTGGYTSNVKCVAFKYIYAAPGLGIEISNPDPFKILEHNVDIVRKRNPQIK